MECVCTVVEPWAESEDLLLRRAGRHAQII
jgi:hypothetical protein